MATFYLDFENGNDANTGADWANAWKTINNGATAARTAPGDTIRIAKTADPTSIGNATWTNKSATVTLATAQTTNIYLDGSWTAANSGAATTSTTRKEGTNASQITTAASTATSTKYAYYTIGGGSGVDLSSYDAITFWIRNNTVAVVANNYQIKLCSDTTGDTAVDTFDIPAIASSNEWLPITLARNGGGALGSSIQSIAWYTSSVSPGNSRQVLLDDILACDNTGLNLTSLISKNSAAYGGSETWHGLQSIDGTTVILGNTNSLITNNSGLRGYFTTGTSPETVTTYSRPTYKFAMQSGGSGAQPIKESGTAGNLITYSGGWNTTSNTQDGETWIDGTNGIGFGMDLRDINYIKVERFGLCRFAEAIRGSTSLLNTGWDINAIITNSGTACNVSCNKGIFSILANNNNNPFSVQTSGAVETIYNLKAYNNSATNASSIAAGNCSNLIYVNSGNQTLNVPANINIDYLEISDNASGSNATVNITGPYVNVKEAKINNNAATNFLRGTGNIIINKLTATGNSNVGTLTGTLTVKQTDATSSQLLGSTSSTAILYNYPALMYNGVNNNIDDNRSFWAYGNALSQTTTRHTASGIAWQINITNNTQTSDFPIYFPIAKVACAANSLVTVKAWVKLSHATDIGAKLMIQNGEIPGVTADVTATKTANTNWEELTITFTPTATGVAQIYIQGYWLANTADESIYVDDITITQA